MFILDALIISVLFIYSVSIFCVLSLVKPAKMSWNLLKKIWSWNFTSCSWEPWCCAGCCWQHDWNIVVQHSDFSR